MFLVVLIVPLGHGGRDLGFLFTVRIAHDFDFVLLPWAEHAGAVGNQLFEQRLHLGNFLRHDALVHVRRERFVVPAGASPVPAKVVPAG